jgi:acyl-CoA thioesterase I
MNRFILLFADGTMFFVGMPLTVVAVCSARWLTEQGWRSVSTIGSTIGILLVIVSATPVSPWVYGAWLALCVSALILSARNTVDDSNHTVPWVHRTLLVLTAGLSILLCFQEWPYRRKPEIAVSPGTMIYVVGDSISAGMGTKERNWPEVLADSTELSIVNLACPGATVKTAFAQLEEIPLRPSLVIVEIGGNDLLGGTKSDAFEDSLDALLARLRSDGHRIVMFELPLPPFHNAFGRAQRGAARRHDATLIPKGCMTGVFGARDSTLDGLHLSQSGHDALAEEVEQMLRLTD